MKLREKEAAYQERLKNWESRERKKSREYEKENDREDERRAEEAREGRRLKEFLEDYDDLRDDPKFYKGSGLQRRQREREKEKELDNRDRQKEKEEFEEIKRKLFDQGHPDAETEVARMEREREEHLQPRLHLQEIKQAPATVTLHESDSESEEESVKERLQPERHVERHAERHVERSNHSERQITDRSQLEPVRQHHDSPKVPTHQSSRSNFHAPPQQPPLPAPEHKPSPSLSTSPISTDSRISAPGPSVSPDSSSLPGMVVPQEGKRKKLTVDSVFNQDDDNNEPKKRKLIPLDYGEEDQSEPADKKSCNCRREKTENQTTY